MEFDSSFFDAGLERRHTDCEKWDGMVDEHHDPEMIPMWVADMDFRSAPAIADAVKRVAEQGTWGYTLSGERDGRCAITGSAATGSALSRRTCRWGRASSPNCGSASAR